MNETQGRFSNQTGDTPLWIPPTPQDLIPNFERLRATLQVEKQAGEDRQNGMPRSTDTDLNQTQDEIRQRAVDAIRQLDGNLMDYLTAALPYMVDDSEEINSAGRVAELESSLNMVLRIAEPLNSHAVNFVAATEERQHFVRKNRLNPPAQYQDNLSMFVAALIAALLGESLINSLVLKEVNGYGLIGGLGVAMLISALNLALGLAGGAGWRLLNHRQLIQKAIGACVTSVATVLALGCNLLAAHYRQVAEDSIKDPVAVRSALDSSLVSVKPAGAAELFTSAMPRAEQLEASVHHLRQAGWLGFQSIWSWVLLAAGIGIFFAVCYKSWDDYGRYWGYRARDLRRQRAEDALDNYLGDLENEALDDIHQHTTACKQAVTDLEHKGSKAIQVATHAERRYGEMIDHVDRWGLIANRLLKLYRQENAQGYSQSLPAYWNTYWTPGDYRQLVSTERPQPALHSERMASPMQMIRSQSKRLQPILSSSRRQRDDFIGIAEELSQSVPGRIHDLRTQVLEQARQKVAQLFPRKT